MQLSLLNIIRAVHHMGTLLMDDLVNKEIDARLDEVLWKIEQLLEPEEIALIRWACGKSYDTTLKESKNVFDHGNI